MESNGNLTGSSGGVATLDRPTAVDLSHDEMRQLFELMLLSRMLDERMILMNRAGRAAFQISCQGHEGVAGIVFALDPSRDWLVPYYRDLPAVLRFGLTPRDLLFSLLAKQGEPNSGGRQMPAHYGSRKHRIVTTGSPVGTQIPQAAGVALAAKIRGEDSVVYTAIGEGGTSEGDFHEGLNWAGIYKLPVLFVVQNNHYAISVPFEKQSAVQDISVRAEGYGMVGVSISGNDALEVYRVGKEAVERARRGEGPTLIEVKVHRFTPHSSDDDHFLYRSKEELAQERQDDPLIVTGNRLKELGALTDDQEQEMRARFREIINQAGEEAENAPYPDPSEAFTQVYAPEGTTV
jgi:2-oxoisovalerate dehydrogenase E1 component alpha subunit